MDFVLGIDAGGTYFRIKAVSLDGECFGFVRNPSLGYFSEQPEYYVDSMKMYLRECLMQFNGSMTDCRGLVAGVSGIDSEEDRKDLEDVLRDISGCKTICMNDAELANEGINAGPGILLNSGTGSIAFGKNEKGVKAREGGWPLKIFGDEGSGAWLALKTIRLGASWFDELVDDSLLVKLFFKEFGITNQKTFMDFALSFDSEQLAKIGPLVDKAANEGDRYAIDLLNQAAFESYKLVDDLAGRLGYKKDDSFKIGLWGSNILNSEIHYRRFCDYIHSNYSNALIHKSDSGIIDFAVELALKEESRSEHL